MCHNEVMSILTTISDITDAELANLNKPAFEFRLRGLGVPVISQRLFAMGRLRIVADGIWDAMPE